MFCLCSKNPDVVNNNNIFKSYQMTDFQRINVILLFSFIQSMIGHN